MEQSIKYWLQQTSIKLLLALANCVPKYQCNDRNKVYISLTPCALVPDQQLLKIGHPNEHCRTG